VTPYWERGRNELMPVSLAIIAVIVCARAVGVPLLRVLELIVNNWDE
jgi:hypothetical protein